MKPLLMLLNRCYIVTVCSNVSTTALCASAFVAQLRVSRAAGAEDPSSKLCVCSCYCRLSRFLYIYYSSAIQRGLAGVQFVYISIGCIDFVVYE